MLVCFLDEKVGDLRGAQRDAVRRRGQDGLTAARKYGGELLVESQNNS